MKPPSKVKFLGVGITPLTWDELHNVIAHTIYSGEKRTIANHNLHSIYLYAHNKIMKQYCDQSEWIYIDGMPLIILGRLLGYNLRFEQRVTFIDWRPLFSEIHCRGWRVFYLGSRPGVAQTGIEILRQDFPDLNIECSHGYFDTAKGSAGNEEVLARINEFRPQILLVGMGMPLQEAWILDNFHRLDANVICNCGATIDYISGAIATPPRWMGKLCLDWLYRLCCEPKRLCRRYLLEPWYIAWLFVVEVFKGRLWRDHYKDRKKTP